MRFTLLIILSILPLISILNIVYTGITFCTSDNQTCEFKFFPEKINVTLYVYDNTLQTLYEKINGTNVYGFNITDDYLDKLILVNGTVIWSLPYARKLNIPVIDVTQARKKITVYITISNPYASQYQTPIYLIFWESVENVKRWGQLAILHGITPGNPSQIIVDIPFYWYETYGSIFLVSIVTGANKSFVPIQFSDIIYLSIGEYRAPRGSVVITPSGVEYKKISPFFEIKLQPVLVWFRNLSTNSILGIIALAGVLGLWIAAMRQNIDIYKSSVLACGILAAFGLIIGNYWVFAAALVGIIVVLAVAKARTTY